MLDDKSSSSQNEDKKVSASSVEVGAKKGRVLTPAEQKKLLFAKTDAKSRSKGSDEVLDRFNERANLVNDPGNGAVVGNGIPSDYEVKFKREYYAHLFRLLGLKVIDENYQRKPMILAAVTLKLIYLRFPYGTLRRLRELNPKINGKRLFKYFQLLTALGEIGLVQFLKEANDLMATCTHHDEFMRKFSQQYNKPWQAHLFDKNSA